MQSYCKVQLMFFKWFRMLNKLKISTGEMVHICLYVFKICLYSFWTRYVLDALQYLSNTKEP